MQYEGCLKRGSGLVPDPDRAADADAPARKQVGAQPGPMSQRLDHWLAGQRDEVGARLTQLGGTRQNIADPELLANQLVETDAARGQVAARLAGREVDAGFTCESLHLLGLDQRHVAALVGVVFPEPVSPRVAVPGQANAGYDLHRIQRPHRRAGGLRDVNVLNGSAHSRGLIQRPVRRLLESEYAASRMARGIHAATFPGENPEYRLARNSLQRR